MAPRYCNQPIYLEKLTSNFPNLSVPSVSCYDPNMFYVNKTVSGRGIEIHTQIHTPISREYIYGVLKMLILSEGENATGGWEWKEVFTFKSILSEFPFMLFLSISH